jgi:type II secretory pathway component PulF
MSVAEYRYQALTSTGQTRRGRLEANDERDAYRQLAEQGLTLVRLTADSASWYEFEQRKASMQQVAAFTRELSVLVEARVPLSHGLRGIAEGERNQAMRRMLLDIATSIESGKTVTESISRHKSTFGEVYIHTLAGAERSGNLVEVLSLLADMLDKQIESSQQLRRALTYPIVVLSVVLGALAVILIFVVPRFGQTFASSGVELPWITIAIQGVAAWLKLNWWAVGLAVASSLIGLIAAWRSSGGRIHLERMLIKLPLFGRIITAVTTARFARVFGLSLSSGLDVVESLEIGGSSTGRASFKVECSMVCGRVRSGDDMHKVLDEVSSLPGFAKRMLSAGKDSSELSRSCSVVAKHFEREADHLTKSISQMLEPLLTICLAVVVLLVALSVFLPMWKMVAIGH